MGDIESGLANVRRQRRDRPMVFYLCGGTCLAMVVGLIALLASIHTLGPEEQLLVTTDGGAGKEVINGPSTFLMSRLRTTELRKAVRLSPQEYAVVKNVRSGEPRHESGPDLLFLGAWDELLDKRTKIVLQARQYVRLEDSFSGLVRVEAGPQRIMPKPHEQSSAGVQQAVQLRSMDALIVLNKTSGRERVIRREGFFIPDAYEEVMELRHASVLKQMEYAIVRNNVSGEYRNEEGPQLLFIGAYDDLVSVRPKIVLVKQEYVRLVDQRNGYARVVTGPQVIVPRPMEDGPGGMQHEVKRSIIISSQISVVLLNKTSGRKYDVRDEGMFTPGPYEEVLEVRNATVLRGQEYAVVQNELTGKFIHYSGPTQLFVGAYERLFKVLPKIVLQKQQYVQLVDRRTGEETVISGPQTIVPEPEQCEKDYEEDCAMLVKQAIVMKADVAVLTLNKTSGIKQVIRVDSGGIFTPRPYEEIVEVRKAIVLKQQEYAVVKNNMNGSYRHVLGPQLFHLEALDELVSVSSKVVLARYDYIRLVDEQTGAERILEGPLVFAPEPTEVSIRDDNNSRSRAHTEMVQHAILIDAEHAALVLNQANGQQGLVTAEGMWIPSPYECLMELRPRVRVLANEAVVVRDFDGRLTVYDGTAGGAGTSFFLQPRSLVVQMLWSKYGVPGDSGEAIVTKEKVDKIDMRIQRTLYSYEVRTNDNVKLMLLGSIFWRVRNVTSMILGTSDPSGDVWHHSRSSFMQSVSNTTFDSFMGSFNSLAKSAFEREAADNFYAERGVELLSMEVTRFEAVDAETKETLRRINEETTNQITLLKKQQGENAVRSAKMRADLALQEEQTQAEVSLEVQKTNLIRTRAENILMQQKMEAEGLAQPFAQHARSFISALNDTGLSLTSGLDLYRALREAEYHNTDTANLASGRATLFLTSQDVKLNIRDLNFGGTNSSSADGEHRHDL